ncbi:hypothetical protein CABS02_14602 [Colletotrichum abscissum]|uniref:Uncharacterized protein n=1 Tax=Colletotrichum abscissum TaxID=1671311 RepID=A0A9P9X0U4_9PEZI|nr:hypothetical protein CABS02_14602 [Colletotrichum abscissum]
MQHQETIKAASHGTGTSEPKQRCAWWPLGRAAGERTHAVAEESLPYKTGRSIDRWSAARQVAGAQKASASAGLKVLGCGRCQDYPMTRRCEAPISVSILQVDPASDGIVLIATRRCGAAAGFSPAAIRESGLGDSLVLWQQVASADQPVSGDARYCRRTPGRRYPAKSTALACGRLPPRRSARYLSSTWPNVLHCGRHCPSELALERLGTATIPTRAPGKMRSCLPQATELAPKFAVAKVEQAHDKTARGDAGGRVAAVTPLSVHYACLARDDSVMIPSLAAAATMPVVATTTKPMPVAPLAAARSILSGLLLHRTCTPTKSAVVLTRVPHVHFALNRYTANLFALQSAPRNVREYTTAYHAVRAKMYALAVTPKPERPVPISWVVRHGHSASRPDSLELIEKSASTRMRCLAGTISATALFEFFAQC